MLHLLHCEPTNSHRVLSVPLLSIAAQLRSLPPSYDPVVSRHVLVAQAGGPTGGSRRTGPEERERGTRATDLVTDCQLLRSVCPYVDVLAPTPTRFRVSVVCLCACVLFISLLPQRCLHGYTFARMYMQLSPKGDLGAAER